MLNRHCIDNILEKQHSQPRPKQIDERSLLERNRIERSWREGGIFLHRAQDRPRSFTDDIDCSVAPVRYQGTSRCCCADCLHQPSLSWLRRSPPSMFLDRDKRRGSCFAGHLHSMRYDRDCRALGNSTLATRPKQQLPAGVSGVSRRKKRHRTAFTPTQLLGLENAFDQSHYSVGEERKHLAVFLGLSETQIKVWFQNRRTKWKRIRKEAEEEDILDDEEEAETNTDTYASYDSYHPRCNAESLENNVYSYPPERRWSLHSWAGEDRVPY